MNKLQYYCMREYFLSLIDWAMINIHHLHNTNKNFKIELKIFRISIRIFEGNGKLNLTL